jgi:hypothetical protein
MGLTTASLARFRARADAAGIAVFRERLAALGEEITFHGREAIRVIVATGDHLRELVEGGMADEGEVRVKYLAADLTFIPAQGAAVTFQGRKYRLAKNRLVPGAFIGEFELRPVRR